MPDLDILYSQIAAAIIALGGKRQGKTGATQRFHKREGSSYPKTFIVLPLRVKVDDPEVNRPDKCDVQHGVVGCRTPQNHLIANFRLRVFRSYSKASRL